jgi:hypothetical protein
MISLEQVAWELSLGFCGCPTLRRLREGWDAFRLLQSEKCPSDRLSTRHPILHLAELSRLVVLTLPLRDGLAQFGPNL